MKLLCVSLLICLSVGMYAATLPPEPTWPAWVGVTEGADTSNPDKGTSDNHDGFDHGSDQWGWWANLEVPHPTDGTIIKVEMRYIVPEEADYGGGRPGTGYAYYMGAPPDEQGAMPYEKPQKPIPLTQINSNRPMWVAADECSQLLWEAVMSTVLVEKIPHTDEDIDKVSTVTFLGPKNIRAVESQTWTSVDQFISNLNGAITANVDLPTEVEWEFLCRAGTATAFNTGRLLEGTITSSSSAVADLKVRTDKMLTPYDAINVEKMWGGDPLHDPVSNPPDNYTRPWNVLITLVNADKEGITSAIGSDIRGELIIESGTVSFQVSALFDSRYQHRYVPDPYGEYTPILMLYYKDGDDFLPRPYGSASGANMYYRKLQLTTPGVYDDPNDYIACTTYNPIASDSKDDHPVFGQLEYREMIKIIDPQSSTFTVEETSGGSTTTATHSVLNIYKPTPFWTVGSVADSTTPNAVSHSLITDMARSVVPENEAMSTDDYVKAYFKAIKDKYDGKDIDTKVYFDNHPNPQYSYDVMTTFPAKTSFVGENGSWFMEDGIAVIGQGNVSGVRGAGGRNTWGLYDMHGDVEEWCKDEWDGRSAPGSSSTTTPKKYVTRGGSWRLSADRCRSAARTARLDKGYDDVGFRFIIRE